MDPNRGIVGEYAVRGGSYTIAIDSAGNIWIGSDGSTNIIELGPNDGTIKTYAVNGYPRAIAIDSSGNVWVANNGNGIPGSHFKNDNNVEVLYGVAASGQYFPYSGPDWP